MNVVVLAVIQALLLPVQSRAGEPESPFYGAQEFKHSSISMKECVQDATKLLSENEAFWVWMDAHGYFVLPSKNHELGQEGLEGKAARPSPLEIKGLPEVGVGKSSVSELQATVVSLCLDLYPELKIEFSAPSWKELLKANWSEWKLAGFDSKKEGLSFFVIQSLVRASTLYETRFLQGVVDGLSEFTTELIEKQTGLDPNERELLLTFSKRPFSQVKRVAFQFNRKLGYVEGESTLFLKINAPLMELLLVLIREKCHLNTRAQLLREKSRVESEDGFTSEDWVYLTLEEGVRELYWSARLEAAIQDKKWDAEKGLIDSFSTVWNRYRPFHQTQKSALETFKQDWERSSREVQLETLKGWVESLQ